MKLLLPLPTFPLTLVLLCGFPSTTGAGLVTLPSFETTTDSNGRTTLKNWMVMTGNPTPGSTPVAGSQNVALPYLNMPATSWIMSIPHFTVQPGDYIDIWVAGSHTGDGLQSGQLAIALGYSWQDGPSDPFFRDTPFRPYRFVFDQAIVDQPIAIDSFGPGGTILGNPAPQVLPEPSTLLLFGLTALGVAGYGWLRRRRAGVPCPAR